MDAHAIVSTFRSHIRALRWLDLPFRGLQFGELGENAVPS